MAQMNLNVGIKGLKQGTNILDIKVPEIMRKRMTIGIPWVDNAFGNGEENGLVPTSVAMLTGTPGAGKTTLMLQAADAITAKGHICLYNSGEESLYQVRMVTERLGLKNGFICGQDIMLPELLTKADNIRKLNPGKQVFLLQDSLQTLNDGFYKDGGTTSNTPLRCAEMLTDWTKSTTAISMFIGQVTKGGEFAGKNAILHAIDVRAKLYIDLNQKSETYGERIFEVTKNRFGRAGTAYIVELEKSGLREAGSISYTDSDG